METYTKIRLNKLKKDELVALAEELTKTEADKKANKADLITVILRLQDSNKDTFKLSAKDQYKESRIENMNDLAERIWSGQSISEPLIWRVNRIKDQLTEKGYEDLLDKLELPADGFKKYM